MAAAMASATPPATSSTLPLKQFEVALLNAEKVLARFLEQPPGPHLFFEATLRSLARQAAALVQRAAASRAQRAWRRYRALRTKGASEQPSKAQKESSRTLSPQKSSPLPQQACPGPAVVAKTSVPTEPHGPPEPPMEIGRAPAPQKSPPSKTKDTPPVAAKPSLLVRPFAPQEPCKDKGALNPIEKRRQMVVSQLAAANPNRLARNRRLVLEKESCTSTTPATAAVGSSQKPPQPVTPATNHAADVFGDPCAKQGIDSPHARQIEPPRSSTPRSRPSSANRYCGNGASAQPVDFDGRRSCTPSRHSLNTNLRDSSKTPEPALRPRRETSPSRHALGQASPLHAPSAMASSAPLPGSASRSVPTDLLLKEDLDDDPLEFLSSARSGDLGVASPSPGGGRSVSAGFSMAPPSPGGSLRVEGSSNGLIPKHAGASKSSQITHKNMTPPGTASTMDTMGLSGHFSLGGSLTFPLMP